LLAILTSALIDYSIRIQNLEFIFFKSQLLQFSVHWLHEFYKNLFF